MRVIKPCPMIQSYIKSILMRIIVVALLVAAVFASYDVKWDCAPALPPQLEKTASASREAPSPATKSASMINILPVRTPDSSSRCFSPSVAGRHARDAESISLWAASFNRHVHKTKTAKTWSPPSIFSTPSTPLPQGQVTIGAETSRVGSVKV